MAHQIRDVQWMDSRLAPAIFSPRNLGGRDAFHNWQLLHRHCHDKKTAEDRSAAGTNDNRQMIEKPCDTKVSSTVLKPSGGSDPVA